ncbi:DUF4142 domain-containing protein [Robbsia sp. Bb-Pol-6]|uniref:DUF4142 domain-containing protein n=1 Tax=Robbsia betulipollinis TaxID=2981849 RepID=A0ABT3ZSX9_9BURK|nr:DUF4142 domain-containing protein [Robbsia betulipollinis]MCY0389045.1 DUF4142 domain-containing protein [Robbsia betulipollinis]
MKTLSFRSSAAVACASAALLLTPALSSVAFAQASGASASGATLSAVDQKFVDVATQSDATEIATAKLAMAQSQDKDVKMFARHMRVDHMKLSMGLKSAAPHDVTLPKDNVDPAVMDALKGLKGKAFDDAYIKQVGVAGHQKAVMAFQDEVANGTNADLKKAASKSLPVIEGHLRMGQALAKKKGVSE